MMSDATRRLLCRALFILLAMLPTLGVFAWAMSYHLPGGQRRLENELSRSLGWNVSLEEVAYPRPGLTIYRGLKLANAEFGTPLAEIDTLQAVENGAGLTLLAGQVNVTEAGGPTLWEALQSNLRQSVAVTWEFHAEHVRVAAGGKHHPLSDFRARNNPALSGSSALVLFRIRNGDDAREDIQLKLARNRQSSPPSTAWELRTGPSILPVGLLRVLLPELIRFGDNARFRGVLAASQADAEAGQPRGDWGCDVSGLIDQANLATATGGALPGLLEGIARFEIEHAQIRQGRLQSASALVYGGAGRVSGLLVLAAAAALDLESTAPATAEFSASMIPYERIGLALGMNSRGLLLRGMCENSQPGTIVGSMNGPLLRTQEPEHALQPLAGLLQLVSPTVAPVSPATSESQALARVLPLATPEKNRPPD